VTPPEEAERWLAEARENLAAAHVLFEKKHFSVCAFHCQQTGELALKALLYARNQRVLGHSLVGLLSRAVNSGYPEVDAELREAAEGLDEYYISPRYPDAFDARLPSEHYTGEIAEEALKWAHQILSYVTENLP